jgi:hypothetical protein
VKPDTTADYDFFLACSYIRICWFNKHKKYFMLETSKKITSGRIWTFIVWRVIWTKKNPSVCISIVPFYLEFLFFRFFQNRINEFLKEATSSMVRFFLNATSNKHFLFYSSWREGDRTNKIHQKINFWFLFFPVIP